MDIVEVSKMVEGRGGKKLSDIVEKFKLGQASPPAIYTHPEVHADYYALLGVPATATMAELKRAYRDKAREAHPDKSQAQGGPAGGSDDVFRLLARAEEVLTTPALRAAYDRGENVDDSKVERRIRELWRIRQEAAPKPDR